MKITDSPTFCSKPWTTLNIDHTGRVLPCLSSMGGDKQGNENTVGNIKENNIQSIIQDVKLHEIKQTIARGEWHPFCNKCQQNELSSGISDRLEKTVPAKIIKRIDKDINYFKLTRLSINWSNLCNLTCTYCNPRTSTAWQQLMKLPITHVRNDSAGLIELIKDNRDSLTGITFGGGEPLLQPRLLELLQEMNPKNTDVIITTNLSMNLDKNPVYQELRTWPTVKWMISFDNIEPAKFEYVRAGASWALFEHNIRQLKQDGQYIQAHPAYSIYCAFDLVSYYEFCQAYDLSIYWCDLKHPLELDVRQLSKRQQKQARTEIDHILELYGNNPENEQKLSLGILRRYRSQLGVSSNSNGIDPAQWHQTQEQFLGQKHTFSELWPRFNQRSGIIAS